MTDTPQNQVMYKLGAVESEVKSLRESLDQAFRRLEDKIDDTVSHNALTVSNLTDRVNKNENRLNTLERWKDQQVTRMALVVSIISVFWVAFGSAIEARVGNMF